MAVTTIAWVTTTPRNVLMTPSITGSIQGDEQPASGEFVRQRFTDFWPIKPSFELGSLQLGSHLLPRLAGLVD